MPADLVWSAEGEHGSRFWSCASYVDETPVSGGVAYDTCWISRRPRVEYVPIAVCAAAGPSPGRLCLSLGRQCSPRNESADNHVFAPTHTGRVTGLSILERVVVLCTRHRPSFSFRFITVSYSTCNATTGSGDLDVAVPCARRSGRDRRLARPYAYESVCRNRLAPRVGACSLPQISRAHLSRTWVDPLPDCSR